MNKTKKTHKIKLKWIVSSVLLFLAVFMISFGVIAYLSYQKDISATTQASSSVDITVENGDTIDKVADKLKDSNLISSKSSFKIYASLNNKTNIIAGKYSISPDMTIPKILDLINSGQINTSLTITFLPGGTVAMAKDVLKNSGFSSSEIDEAFSKDYSSQFPQLFASKPSDSDLEGFMFGETYSFEHDTSVEDILKRVFTEMQKYVINLDLSNKFSEQGLNLYQGITLASIIQREVTGLDDQKAVAGVFYNRLRSGMTLGSDVTYQYIADKLGVARDYNLDSPYNLRLYTGLTPTPISTPGASALTAASNPSENNYLYFLSGDDGKTYFATTNDEHEQNIVNYCQEKCKII